MWLSVDRASSRAWPPMSRCGLHRRGMRPRSSRLSSVRRFVTRSSGIPVFVRRLLRVRLATVSCDVLSCLYSLVHSSHVTSVSEPCRQPATPCTCPRAATARTLSAALPRAWGAEKCKIRKWRGRLGHPCVAQAFRDVDIDIDAIWSSGKTSGAPLQHQQGYSIFCFAEDLRLVRPLMRCLSWVWRAMLQVGGDWDGTAAPKQF